MRLCSPSCLHFFFAKGFVFSIPNSLKLTKKKEKKFFLKFKEDYPKTKKKLKIQKSYIFVAYYIYIYIVEAHTVESVKKSFVK